MLTQRMHKLTGMENQLSLFSSIDLLREAALQNEGRLGEKRSPIGGILSGSYCCHT